ncbi:MAG: alginate export family protein [Gammaproteobacteria bacterium]
MRLLKLTLLCIFGVLPFHATCLEADTTLHSLLNLPTWIDVGVSNRIRYETLDGQFRARGRGGDQGLAIQTLAHAELGAPRLRIGAEMIDARMLYDDGGTPLDTTHVDSLDLLQAYLVMHAESPSERGVTSTWRVGRQTLDFGSRRLIARNRFRNTINAFTGVHWLCGDSHRRMDMFLGSPVNRQPTARGALAADDAALDEEDFGSLLWLLGWQWAPNARDIVVELYVVGLHEGDARFETRNRRIVTPALRLLRGAAPGRFDFQLEAMLQIGTVRSDDAPTNRRDLAHLAHYETLQIGYTAESEWHPRLSAMFDYASGDSDPTDSNSGRFDTLFGARRFDYGPTGLWGAFQRSNVVSPGVRINAAPGSTVQIMAAYRAFWLASRRDAWTPARLLDRSGRAGSFLGHNIEASVSLAVVPTRVSWELGGAVLVGGTFISHVAEAPSVSDSAYLYSHVTFAF